MSNCLYVIQLKEGSYHTNSPVVLNFIYIFSRMVSDSLKFKLHNSRPSAPVAILKKTPNKLALSPISEFLCISPVKEMYNVLDDSISYILHIQFVFSGYIFTEILNFKRSKIYIIRKFANML